MATVIVKRRIGKHWPPIGEPMDVPDQLAPLMVDVGYVEPQAPAKKPSAVAAVVDLPEDD